jgi:outer membrane receptor protein involved in Fe transport
MAGAFYEDVWDWWEYDAITPGLTGTRAWEAAQYYACYGAELGYDVQCPLPNTDIYYQDVYDKTIKQTAVFGEATFNLTDKWKVTGGARWFEYDRDVVETYSVPKGLPVQHDFAGGGVNASKGNESDTVFKFGTEYRFDEHRMIYLLYSEGFRLGGNNSARAAEAGYLPLVYEPDKLANYEAGLKSQWFDNVLQLNVSLFFMEWDNIQLNTSGSNLGNQWWLRGTFNGGKAEQKGAEISVSWAVTENLSIDASAFLADPEFSEKTEFPEPGEGNAIEAGTVMPVSPERKYFVSAEYKVPNFLSAGDLWGRISYSYQGSVWKDLDAILDYQNAETPEERELALDQKLPSWATTTLQIGYTNKTGGWETSLIVRNLFDEQGYDYLSSSDYGALFGDPRWRYVRTLQRPLTVGLSFTKKW